jgi:two-component system sensor histidine kinase KdpD
MSISRPDPEQLLRQVQAEETDRLRGRLKVFLGYASGVGKSLRMLDEARRRKQRGEDVVVAATQPKVSPEVEALLRKLEVIPLRTVDGTPVMDVPAILRRHPGVCVVDGLAYDNPPGSPHGKRWEDVEELLAMGVSVLASVNLQHIEEYREQVERITGKRVTETIPKDFLKFAEEIEVVDAPPELALERASAASPQDGNAPEGSVAAWEHRLSQLREMALLLAADVVDFQLEGYLHRHGIEQLWGTHERILVWITPYADAVTMIASGKRNADRFQGELFVATVAQPDLTPAEQKVLNINLAHAQQARAQIEFLDGENQVDAVMRFAMSRGITQIFVGRAMRENTWERILGNDLDRLIQAAEGIDIRVFPQ